MGWRGEAVGDAGGQRAITGVWGGLGQNRAVGGKEGLVRTIPKIESGL